MYYIVIFILGYACAVLFKKRKARGIPMDFEIGLQEVGKYREFSNCDSAQVEVPANDEFAQLKLWIDRQLELYPELFQFMQIEEYLTVLSVFSRVELPETLREGEAWIFHHWKEGLDERPIWRKYRQFWGASERKVRRMIKLNELKNLRILRCFTTRKEFEDFYDEHCGFAHMYIESLASFNSGIDHTLARQIFGPSFTPALVGYASGLKNKLFDEWMAQLHEEGTL